MFNKKDIKYYVIIGLILSVIIIFEIMKPKPVDWRFTLEREDKIPYGTYVLFNTLDDIFPGKEIKETKKTVFENYNYNDFETKNYIYISNSFNPDEYDTEIILELAETGCNVFISAYSFSNVFSDTLNFKIDNSSYFDTSSVLNFYNTKIKQKKDYYYGRSSANFYFKSIDTVKSEILGYSKEKRITFIRYKHGKGCIYLNTVPEAYTNYAMVTEKNYGFAYNSLSYLPVFDVVWDEYYKDFRRNEQGALSMIFSNMSFKYAYYLLLALTVIFVLFTAKRRQRIIPVIKPHKNTSLEFIKTIGRLYYHSKNHRDIALKKFNYLQHFIITKYYINIADLKGQSFKKIAEKTGTNTDIVKKVLLSHAKINKLEKISAQQLNQFNNYIEEFYEKCK